MRALFLDAALVATFTLGPAAWAYDAVVSTCHDGDTCTLADGTRIRLHAIDVPELDQPYGPQAGALINSLIAGRHVDVRLTVNRRPTLTPWRRGNWGRKAGEG
jgi:endonuclease YncB( thermonuclease family)